MTSFLAQTTYFLRIFLVFKAIKFAMINFYKRKGFSDFAI